jgi:FAD synthetase
VAFGGGKDGLVVLELTLQALLTQPGFAKHCLFPVLVLERRAAPFDAALNAAIAAAEASFAVAFQFHRLVCDTLADGLRTWMAERQPGLRAVFMGCRDSDRAGGPPFPAAGEASTLPFPTALWRLYPIRAWTHAQVWAYIGAQELPYCRLYDEGYTSLGTGRADSRPNARLAGAPAYTLSEADADTERHGRE